MGVWALEFKTDGGVALNAISRVSLGSEFGGEAMRTSSFWLLGAYLRDGINN